MCELYELSVSKHRHDRHRALLFLLLPLLPQWPEKYWKQQSLSSLDPDPQVSLCLPRLHGLFRVKYLWKPEQDSISIYQVYQIHS